VTGAKGIVSIPGCRNETFSSFTERFAEVVKEEAGARCTLEARERRKSEVVAYAADAWPKWKPRHGKQSLWVAGEVNRRLRVTGRLITGKWVVQNLGKIEAEIERRKNATGKTKDRDGIYTRKDRPGYWASWIDASGKRRQRKLEAHTLQQARTLLSAEKARVERTLTLGYAPPSEETFSVVVVRFLKHAPELALYRDRSVTGHAPWPGRLH
jgi:hypothetical protein